MKNRIKEIGIVPLILILIGIGVGSTSIYSCNDSCGKANDSCEEGSDTCCEGLDCGVDGRCCVPTGDELTNGATQGDCCSGRSKTMFPLEPAGTPSICCAGEGPTPGENFSCCYGLTWFRNTCYACMETGESLPVPFDTVPCCDATDTQLYRDGISSCVDCPCGELPPGITDPLGTGCRVCPEPIELPPDATVPQTCEPCDDPLNDIQCQQVIVMTKGYCDDPDAPGAECELVTVRTDAREDREIEIAGTCFACAGDDEFATDESGNCDPLLLRAILLENAGLNFDTVPLENLPLLDQVCAFYCGHDTDY